jgi:hypothetical protein
MTSVLSIDHSSSWYTCIYTVILIDELVNILVNSNRKLAVNIEGEITMLWDQDASVIQRS